PMTPPGGQGELTMIPHVRRLANLLVLRSLTKLYALPGLRLGYAVAPHDWARRLRAAEVPWSVNALAQAAGLAAVAADDYRRRTADWLASEVAGFAGRLKQLSERVCPLPSEASFFLV